MDSNRTIFGFVSPDELDTIDLEGLTPPAGANVAVVYKAQAPSYAPMLAQVTTYEVRGDVLVETVVGSIDAVPNTMYETHIFGSDDEHLVLESTSAETGQRTYTRSERCAGESVTGWGIAFINDDETFGGVGELVIADDGTLHGLRPGHWTRGSPCQSPHINFPVGYRFVAGALRGGEVHVLLERMDASVEHYWRVGDEWQGGEKVAPAPASGQPVYAMKLFVDGDDFVGVVARADADTAIYRQTAGAWSAVPVAFPQPQRIEDAALAPDGSLVLISRQAVRRVVGTTVTDTPLPMGAVELGALTASVLVDTDGSVHAAWNFDQLSQGMVVGYRGIYGILDGATWTTHDIGPAAYPRVLPPAGDVLRVVNATVKASAPAAALTQLGRDGTIRSSATIAVGGSFGIGLSPQPIQFRAAAGADGTLAVTTWFQTGYQTLLRTAKPAVERAPFSVTFDINGPGRVYTDDGVVDCTATCTVDVPFGTRLPIKLAPAAGYTGTSNGCQIDQAYPLYGWCWHETAPDTGNIPRTYTISFTPA